MGLFDEKGKALRIVAVLVLLVFVVEFLLSFRARLNAGATASEQSSFELEPVFPALSFKNPVGLVHAGDSRIFVMEQAGKLKVFSKASGADARDFLDISERVRSGGEMGLLGAAFHPKFKENGLLFIHYSSKPDGDTALAKFQLRKDDAARADETSEEMLLRVEQPYTNHNGGELVFGPDGYLYLGLGDGGSGGDPHKNGQNLNTLLGKILRLDADRPSSRRLYGIPSDNPFVSQPDARPEIFAYGLRNPWRFSFDVLTGRLWAADVGQNSLEEIDIIEKGKNYGWNIMEGSSCFSFPMLCKKSGLELPVFEYDREEGQSITGGYVYRGKRLPGLFGRYIYGDYVSGRIWALDQADGKIRNILIAESRLAISSFGVDVENELYVLSHGDGRLYQLRAR